MCHTYHMTPFKVKIKPGQSIFEQVVFAATKAILGGSLKRGQTFPSVRTLATDLRIHPNTAHKVVQHLIQERWLDVRPGIGTTVAEPPRARAGERQRFLQQEVDQLVVEANRVGCRLDEVLDAIESRWKEMRPLKAVSDVD